MPVYRRLIRHFLNLIATLDRLAHRTANSFQTDPARDLTNRLVIESQSAASSEKARMERPHQKAFIARLLRHFPWWSEGHLLLARLSLIDNDIATTYASALAVNELGTPHAACDQAIFLLGTSYLRRGDPSRALTYFEKLLTSRTLAPSVVKEELAAAYLALHRHNDAEAVLSSIPEEDRSQSAQSALSFIRNRASL